MLSFNRALVIKHCVWVAFLFVQTVVTIHSDKNAFDGINEIFILIVLITGHCLSFNNWTHIRLAKNKKKKHHIFHLKIVISTA